MIEHEIGHEVFLAASFFVAIYIRARKHAEIMTMDVVDNPDKNRFEMAVPGGTAFASYRRSGDVLLVPHTEVPRSVEGQGYGSALMKGVLDHARARGLKVRPLCSFAAAYMQRHPEYEDVRG
jgi:predicted GNAT family acetyltransferase